MKPGLNITRSSLSLTRPCTSILWYRIVSSQAIASASISGFAKPTFFFSDSMIFSSVYRSVSEVSVSWEVEVTFKLSGDIFFLFINSTPCSTTFFFFCFFFIGGAFLLAHFPTNFSKRELFLGAGSSGTTGYCYTGRGLLIWCGRTIGGLALRIEGAFTTFS